MLMRKVTGTTTSSVSRASDTFRVNNTTVMTTSVSACTAKFTKPSWKSWVRASMSLVMRVMSTPAFSFVKYPSDWRCKCENTRTRSWYMSFSPSRPVNAVRSQLAIALMTIEPTYSSATATSTPLFRPAMPLSIPISVSSGPAWRKIVSRSTSTKTAPRLRS